MADDLTPEQLSKLPKAQVQQILKARNDAVFAAIKPPDDLETRAHHARLSALHADLNDCLIISTAQPLLG